MVSPFRLNKKARRRGRKFARRLADEKALAKWDEVSANAFRRVAELSLKMANESAAGSANGREQTEQRRQPWTQFPKPR